MNLVGGYWTHLCIYQWCVYTVVSLLRPTVCKCQLLSLSCRLHSVSLAFSVFLSHIKEHKSSVSLSVPLPRSLSLPPWLIFSSTCTVSPDRLFKCHPC